MRMETWKTGEGAKSVRKKIENNFNKLSRYSSNVIKSLTSEEINLLTDDYCVDGTIVFNTTKNIWQKYNSQNKTWEDFPMLPTYSMEFSLEDWLDGVIEIPYSLHFISNPLVTLFLLNDSGLYETVIGGALVDGNFNVTLLSDLPFSGKVVIK